MSRGWISIGSLLLGMQLTVSPVAWGAEKQGQPSLPGSDSRSEGRTVAPSSKASTDFRYTARTRSGTAKRGKIATAGTLWTCDDRQCTTSATWPTPSVSACSALAREVGEIASFGHSKKQLDASGLRECNRGIAGPGTDGFPGMAAAASRGVIAGPRSLTAPEIPAGVSPGERKPPTLHPSSAAGGTRPGASPVEGVDVTELRRQVKPTATSAIARPPDPRRERVAAYVEHNRLRSSELERMATTLSERGTQRYAFVTTQGEMAAADLAGAETRDGLLVMRDRSRLRKLDEGLFTDEAGTVFEFGELPGAKGEPGSYSISRFAPGNSLATLDADGDGVVDLAVSVREDGGPARYGILANELGSRLWDCFGRKRARSNPSLGGESVLGGSGGDPCAGLRAEQGGGAASGGGGSGTIAGILGGLGGPGEPDCEPAARGGPPGDAGSGGDPSSDDGGDEDYRSSEERRLQELWEQAIRARDRHVEAAREIESHDPEPGSPQANRARAHREAADRAQRLAETASDAIERIQRHQRDPSEDNKHWMEVWIGLTDDALDDYIQVKTKVWGSGSLPIAGAEGATTDPRCEGRKVAASRGLLFMDPDFCDGLDMLTCLVKQEHAVFSATGGRCRPGPSPAGGQMLVCEREEVDRGGDSRDPTCVGGAPGCGGDDVLGSRVRSAKGRQIPVGYVETVPLGAFIANLCQKAGCPGGL